MAWHQNIQQISFSPILPRGNKRSSSKNLLVTPKSNLKFYRDRSFQVAAPRLWNSLTNDIRSIQNLDVFNNKIKHYFLERLLLVGCHPFFLLLYIFPQLIASRLYLIFQKFISTTLLLSILCNKSNIFIYLFIFLELL